VSISIRYISSEESGAWDQLINSSPQGSIFLLNDCLSAYVENDPELHLFRLGCFDDRNNLLGGQALIHKKRAGIVRVQTLVHTWSYLDTPIVAGHIIQGSQEYYAIVYALAHKVRQSFLYYKVFCHPSIQDVRPLLQNQWSAEPEYAHIWDLQNPEALLNELRKKKRFRQADAMFQSLQFSSEKKGEIIEEFIPLYKKTAEQIGCKLSKSWERIFRALVDQMLDRNAIRFLTCRRNSGELLGVTTYVLNQIQNTAYGWQLAHIPLHGEKDFIPALYLYAIKILSTEASSIDIAEGIRPTLYYFKDSLGTRSTPLFSVETPNAKLWKNFITLARRAKQNVGYHSR
jgi:hypothetical protein